MIPKVIHYCWFSEDTMPAQLQNCFKSWKQLLKGYHMKKWDLTNIDIDCPFGEKALQEKKWAFLTDYFRMKILFDQGGIFLDTDVLMVKPFDDLIEYPSFWGFAESKLIEPVVIGAEKGNPIIRDIVKYYQSFTDVKEIQFVEIPRVITPVFEKHGLNVQKFNIPQKLDNAIIFPSDFFCPMPFEKADTNDYYSFATNNTYTIHLWNAAWFDDPFRFFWNNRWKKGWNLVLKQIIKNPIRPVIFYKSIFYHLKRQMRIK